MGAQGALAGLAAVVITSNRPISVNVASILYILRPHFTLDNLGYHTSNTQMRSIRVAAESTIGAKGQVRVYIRTGSLASLPRLTRPSSRDIHEEVKSNANNLLTTFEHLVGILGSIQSEFNQGGGCCTQIGPGGRETGARACSEFYRRVGKSNRAR